MADALGDFDAQVRRGVGCLGRHTVIALGEERAATVRARGDAYIHDHGLKEIVIRGRYVLARG